ncbi:MAG TPA: PEP-utilizing enzyme [Candidatus Saccharimonadales bacterium]|jgi:hypothetical protein|nr:PEP-utilizing enzyme [Candidatus Saccharimonadales bacterium]
MTNIQEKPLATFKSKADTLQLLSTLLQKSSIEEIFAFTQGDWELNKAAVAGRVQNKFQGKVIIVRSSALAEDTAECSNAGYFESVLDVDSANAQAVHHAIEAVIGSYNEKDSGHPANPVLVQTQTMNVISSGTILTRDYNGAPYYVINYSEEDTTSVTSGRHSKTMRILQDDGAKVPADFIGLIEAVKEIQQLARLDAPLDIEFGIKANGQVVTFQVRPLVAAQSAAFKDDQIVGRVARLQDKFLQLSASKPHLSGEVTFFGDMPDWNPAEIIGNSPRLLAATLYGEIITDSVWHQARTSQGYTDVNPAKLVVQFGNKPYVDVRNTFNSLVPAGINAALRQKLMSFYLEKLQANPQLQDKVEFDILFTCYDLSFGRRAQELLDSGFSAAEVAHLRTEVLELTNNLVAANRIAADIGQNEALETYRQNLPVLTESSSLQESIQRTIELLAACKQNGTLQFSRLARLGFIAKSLLRSLVDEGVIDEFVYDNLLASITTVASDFASDTDLLDGGRLSKPDFLKKYGHLRPGTYDITIPRYDATDDYFGAVNTRHMKESYKKETFVFTPEQHVKISEVLQSHGFAATSQELFDFARAALEAREYSKFLFSKSLSDAIEAISLAGKTLGLSRDDLSHLDVQAIKDAVGKDVAAVKKDWQADILRNKTDYQLNSHIPLPPVIFSADDLGVVSYYDSRPSFITSKKVTGDLVFLNGEMRTNITGKIVAIESADPGYDWVFTKKPAALVTKYGGPASHMAIRCAESGLPAVIGAGEMLYESLQQASAIVIDCENERIEPHGKMS